MDAVSLNRLFRAGKLKRDAFGSEVFRPGKPLRLVRPLDAEILEGRHEGGKSGGGGANGAAGLSKRLQKLTGPSKRVARRTLSRGVKSFAFDARQRAIVKMHYFNHGGGGGAALKAHARYVARDAAARAPGERAQALGEDADTGVETKDKARAHGRYLTRGERAVFYDALGDGVDGAKRAAQWAAQDRRHFRLIVAAENGARLGDLKDYTREIMRRAEVALGTRLEWVAVDHWDTDNPHTHVILRGRREDGRDLVIPREFVQHGWRSAARDVATERLGARTPDDERQALRREVRAHRPTRLDQWIEAQLDTQGRVRIAELRAPNGDPDQTDALKGRAHELRRLGLATETRRNVLLFEPGWRDGLKAMELHLDIRKALIQARTRDPSQTQLDQARQLSKALRLGPDR